MFVRSIHIVAGSSRLDILLAGGISFMNIPQRHLGNLQFRVMMGSVAMNTVVHVSWSTNRTDFLLGRRLGPMVCLYLAFPGAARRFSKVVAAIYTPQKLMRGLMAPHPCQHMIFSIFSIFAILVAINGYK